MIYRNNYKLKIMENNFLKACAILWIIFLEEYPNISSDFQVICQQKYYQTKHFQSF